MLGDRVTPNDIVDAALELLGAGGLHALAMRRIASRLGVQQSALYWHFDNKQLLLAAVADRVVAPVEPPVGGDLAARVGALASGLRAELLRYPDGAELVATAFAFRLGGGRPFRQFADELVSAGLPTADAEVAASVLLHYVLGATGDEQQHIQAAALGAIDRVADEAGAARSAEDRFLQGLRLIVAGVEAQAVAEGRRP